MKAFTTNDKEKGLHKIVVLFFWIAIWQILYFIVGRDIYVPSPYSVFERLSQLIFIASFWESVFHSIFRVLIGIIVSIVLGVVLGTLSALNRYVYDLLSPLVTAIKSTPVISFIIVALIWFSSASVPVFICFLMCFPIIWTNVVEGIRNVDRNLLQMAYIYEVKETKILRHIYLPTITPYFVAAGIMALGMGWKVSVAAEVLSHPRYGIGSHLYSAKVYLDSVELFAWTLVVIVLSMLFESTFSWLIRKLHHRKTVATKNESSCELSTNTSR